MIHDNYLLKFSYFEKLEYIVSDELKTLGVEGVSVDISNADREFIEKWKIDELPKIVLINNTIGLKKNNKNSQINKTKGKNRASLYTILAL